MYKGVKKEDLVLVVKEIGEEVTETATVVELKNKIEQSTAFKADADFVRELISTAVEERKRVEKDRLCERSEKLEIERLKLERSEKLEIERLKLAQLEKELELQSARNSANVVNGATIINDNISTDVSAGDVVFSLESLIRSIKVLSMPVPSNPENFNLFFQSLERAFISKSVPTGFQAEILLNLLGEKAQGVLLYIKEEEMKDYEKIKKLVLREFQPTPQECLNNFRKAQRQSGESHIQFATRLTSMFNYYCELREVNDFNSLSALMVSDKMFQTLDRETAAHIGIKQGEGWFEPIELAKECDIYFGSKEKSLRFPSAPKDQNKTTPMSNNQTKASYRAWKDTPKQDWQGRDRGKVKCYICGADHYARFCPKRYDQKSSDRIESRNQKFASGVSNFAKFNHSYADENLLSELKYVNICVNGIHCSALVDSGAQLPILSKSFSNVGNEKLSQDSITLNSCFGEQEMVKLANCQVSYENSYPVDIVFAISSKLATPCIITPKVLEVLRKQSGSQISPTSGSEMTEGETQGSRINNASDSSDGTANFNNVWLNVLNVFEEDSWLDLTHIRVPRVRQEIAGIIKAYKPDKTESTNLKMSIVLSDDIPVNQRARRLSFSEQQEVEKQIKQWLKDGIIQHSCSDYASPIVLCKKKDGSLRLCVDYRKLNKKIIKDRFPLPVIEDVLDRLQAGKVFTTIDLKNGFFHVEVDEKSRKYTSFVTPQGQYEFKRVPFGLCNSPAVFQRYIYHIFRGLMNEGVIVIYMDDMIIPSVDEAEGVKRLKRVLETAAKYGLELNLKKCQFLRRKVDFLGHVVENGTVKPSAEKTKAVQRFPEPRNVRQVQSFLGLTGYFRKFIQGYASIARPLSDMLRKDAVFKFGAEQKDAFLKLIEVLSKDPVLRIYKQGVPLELHTDASSQGFGAILLQPAEDGKLFPIHYMSKKTTPQQEKYCSYELEVLAVVEAVKKFRNYLIGSKFKIVTDCAAFQRTVDKKELIPRIARWVLLLQDFDYEVIHRAGDRMKHVDALSRNPVMLVTTSQDEVTSRISAAQRNDEYINTIKELIQRREANDYGLKSDEAIDYFLKNDVLYKYENGRELLIVPRAMQTEIIGNAHNKGHFSIAKTEEVIKREYFIPELHKRVENVIRNCVPCILANRKAGKQEGFLHPIPKEDIPLSTYHIDFIGPLPSTNKKYQHIFTVVDAFTKFTWLYPVKSTRAEDAIDRLRIQQKTFGNPSRIISDRGAAFTSKDFKDYCDAEGIAHIQITTGIPQGNGQVERMHRVLIPVLTKLSISDPQRWFKHVDHVQRILNSTVSRSTKWSPFELLTGVKMRNAEDLEIRNILEEELKEHILRERTEIRNDAKQNILRIQEENRKTYNRRRKSSHRYKEGDLVAIKRTQFGTGLKLRVKFLGPYKVSKVRSHDRYDVVKVGDHEGPNTTSSAAEFMKPWSQGDLD